MWWAELSTPVGDLAVAVDDAGVCAVRFGRLPEGVTAAGPGVERLDDAVRQLAEYACGERSTFDCRLSIVQRSTAGRPTFDNRVWDALLGIPYGEMRTYGEIAALVGEPDAARAVGVACNRNPIPVIIPCHRVVGAGGKLVGFGGGLPRKVALLELEARVRVEQAFG